MARWRTPPSSPPAARRGGRFFWVGHGTPGRLADPRNWSRRPTGAGGVLPPAGATVVFDGRGSRRETVRVPQGVWGLETRHVRVEGVADGLLVLSLGEEQETRIPVGERLRDEARALADRVRSRVWRLGAYKTQRRLPPPVRSRRYEPVPEIRIVAPWLHALDLVRELREQRLQAVRDLRTGVVLLVPRLSGAATIVAAAGGGNWNATTTWIGGVVPTAGDDVQLASTSGSVTINVAAACRSLDCTGYTGTLTHSAGATLSIGDATAGLSGVALRLVPGMTYTLGSSTTSAVALVSTAASTQTIATGGKTLGNVTLNGLGGRWQHADAASMGNVTLTTGQWDTGSQALTIISFSAPTGDTNSTLALGSSSITVTGSNTTVWSLVPPATVTATAATLMFTGASATLARSELEWANVSVVASGSGTFVMNNSSGCTFQNFTRTGTAVKTDGLQVNTGFGLFGTLTLSGGSTNGVNRLFLMASRVGVRRTIQCAAVVIGGDVAFRDIQIVNTGSWTNAGGSLIGDAGNNAGIAATPSATQTATAAASWSWSDATKWTSRVPLPQDDVVVSITAGAPTVTLDMPRLGRSVDFSGTTVAAVLSFSVATAVYGNLTIPAAMANPTGSSGLSLSGQGVYTINIAKTMPNALTIDCGLGTYILAANYTGASSIGLNSGTFSDGGKTVSATSFASATTAPRTVVLTGTWTLTSASSVWNITSPSTLTADFTACSLTLSSASTGTRTFIGAGFSYKSLAYKSAGSGGLSITGSNTFATLDLEGATARTITLPAGATQTVTTSLTLKGATGQTLSVASSTPGQRTALATSPGCAITQSNDSLSADVSLGTTVRGTAAATLEATAGKRTPRTAAPGSSLPPALVGGTTGTIVACLVPAFASTETDATPSGVLNTFGANTNDTIGLSWRFGFWHGTRSASVVQAGGAHTSLDRHQAFGAGDHLVVGFAWDAATIYLSLGDAFLASGENTLIPAAFTTLRFGSTASGQTWNGTILWLAIFSNKLSDADIAALNASYLASYPDWSDLPATPTMLYRNDWGAYITGEGQTEYVIVDAQKGVVQTDAEVIDAVEQLLADSGNNIESVGPVSALDGVELEALLGGVSAATLLELETLRRLFEQRGLPIESLDWRFVDALARLRFETLGPVAEARPLPLESLESAGLADVLVRLEALGGIAHADALPFEARSHRRGSGDSSDIPVGVAESSDIAATVVESYDTLG